MDSGTQTAASELAASPGATERPLGRRRGDRIAGSSAATQRTVEQASLAARTERPVLVTGPSGSGREHVARAIHAWSSRAAGPIEVLRIGGVPEAQQARELFGTKPGAEPLAGGDFDGVLTRARGGTALVTGADQLNAATRAALSQCLRSGSFQREGDAETLQLDARVILAGNADAPAFLGDVSGHEVTLAPLADRLDDILPLAVHFLAQFAHEEGVEPVGFSADARRCLIEESWPGNVRELRERVRQALILSGNGAISVEALALSNEGDDVPSFKEAKRNFETRYVKGLLRRCGGNISRAARLAKKDRKDFYDVIRRTGVDPQEFRR